MIRIVCGPSEVEKALENYVDTGVQVPVELARQTLEELRGRRLRSEFAADWKNPMNVFPERKP